jgi:hypothetical protein
VEAADVRSYPGLSPGLGISVSGASSCNSAELVRRWSGYAAKARARNESHGEAVCNTDAIAHG